MSVNPTLPSPLPLAHPHTIYSIPKRKGETRPIGTAHKRQTRCSLNRFQSRNLIKCVCLSGVDARIVEMEMRGLELSLGTFPIPRSIELIPYTRTDSNGRIFTIAMTQSMKYDKNMTGLVLFSFESALFMPQTKNILGGYCTWGYFKRTSLIFFRFLSSVVDFIHATDLPGWHFRVSRLLFLTLSSP